MKKSARSACFAPLALLCAVVFSTGALAQKDSLQMEDTVAGPMPVGLSAKLDLISSGASAAYARALICDSAKAKADLVSITEKAKLLISIEDLAAGREEAAWRYALMSAEPKIKALMQANQGKTCAQTESLKALANGVGFFSR